MRLHRALTLSAALALLYGCGGGATGEFADAAAGDVTLPVTTASAEARDHFDMGLRAMDMGDFTEANAHFETAVASDSTFAQGHLMVANTAASLEEFTTNLARAAQHAPAASEEERLLIQITQRGFDNDVEAQLQVARQLVERQPESPRALTTLAGIQSALNDHEGARSSLMRATELSPDFMPAYIQLGNSYLFNGPKDPDRAQELMQQAVDVEPDASIAHDNLGDAYRALGNLEAAREAYTRGAELDPQNGLLRQQRGHVNSFLGDYDAARADYDTAISMGTGNQAPTFARFRAYVSVHAGEPAAAVAELNDLIRGIDSMDVPGPNGLKLATLFDVIMIASHHGMFEACDEAMAMTTELANMQIEQVGTDQFRRGSLANVAYLEGLIAARRGDPTTANAKAAQIMTVLEPDANPRRNEPAHEIMGLTSLIAGDFAAAIGHYEQANLTNIYNVYNLALAHDGAGSAEDAARRFDEVASYNFNFVGYALVRSAAMERAQ